MYTNLRVKKKYFPLFWKEVWGRLEKGKHKYQIQGNSEKEATDIAEEIVPDFQLGDMIKYIAEYRNTRNPKDLFDIAGWCFVKWLVDYEKHKK
jgi:hypothetical protein